VTISYEAELMHGIALTKPECVTKPGGRGADDFVWERDGGGGGGGGWGGARGRRGRWKEEVSVWCCGVRRRSSI
jgi:hypothetical protein